MSSRINLEKQYSFTQSRKSQPRYDLSPKVSQPSRQRNLQYTPNTQNYPSSAYNPSNSLFGAGNRNRLPRDPNTSAIISHYNQSILQDHEYLDVDIEHLMHLQSQIKGRNKKDTSFTNKNDIYSSNTSLSLEWQGFKNANAKMERTNENLNPLKLQRLLREKQIEKAKDYSRGAWYYDNKASNWLGSKSSLQLIDPNYASRNPNMTGTRVTTAANNTIAISQDYTPSRSLLKSKGKKDTRPNYLELNKQESQAFLRQKLHRVPYKHEEVNTKPLDTYKPFLDEELQNIKLQGVSRDLTANRFDADKAVKFAMDTVKCIEYGPNHKNTKTVLEQKANLYRSKLEAINVKHDEQISKKIASVVIQHYVQDVSRNRKSKEREIFRALGLSQEGMMLAGGKRPDSAINLEDWVQDPDQTPKQKNNVSKSIDPQSQRRKPNYRGKRQVIDHAKLAQEAEKQKEEQQKRLKEADEMYRDRVAQLKGLDTELVRVPKIKHELMMKKLEAANNSTY